MELKARCALREIIFRGKRKSDGKWLYGAYLPPDYTHWNEPSIADCNHRFEIRPDSLGQFTELCDSEGKEIYEGDIISFLYRRKTQYGVVVFGNGKYYVKSKADMRRSELSSVKWFTDIHVVGNIHDNPELVKGGEEE